MLQYILRRLLWMIPTLLGITILVFSAESATRAVEMTISGAPAGPYITSETSISPASLAIRSPSALSSMWASMRPASTNLLIAATALLGADPAPAEEAIRAALTPHLCRCGSHPRVLAAVRSVARGASA